SDRRDDLVGSEVSARGERHKCRIQFSLLDQKACCASITGNPEIKSTAVGNRVAAGSWKIADNPTESGTHVRAWSVFCQPGWFLAKFRVLLGRSIRVPRARAAAIICLDGPLAKA